MTAVFPDPAQEFLSQDPTVLREPDPLQPRDIPVAGIAAGLGAAYLGYRHHMRNKVQDEVTKLGPGVTRRALLAVVGSVWQAYIPSWVSKVVPYLVAGYIEGMREAATGEVPEPVLRKIAEGYAKELGEHINNVSQEAMISGFNAQVNRKVPPAMAARRVTNAYGVTRRTMNALVNVWTAKEEQRLTDLPLPSAKEERAKYIIETQNVLRAQQIGETEHWTAKTQAKQVVWMYGQENGVIPKSAHRVWITAHDERVCPTCGPMDGKSAKIGEKFTTSDGDFWTPPAHVRCRCDVALDLTPTEDMQDAITALLEAESVSKARAGDPYDRDARGRFSTAERRGSGGSTARPYAEREAGVDALLRQVNETLSRPISTPEKKSISRPSLRPQYKVARHSVARPSLRPAESQLTPSLRGGEIKSRRMARKLDVPMPPGRIFSPPPEVPRNPVETADGEWDVLDKPVVYIAGGWGQDEIDYSEDRPYLVLVGDEQPWYEVQYENEYPSNYDKSLQRALGEYWQDWISVKDMNYLHDTDHEDRFIYKNGIAYEIDDVVYYDALNEAVENIGPNGSTKVKLKGLGEFSDRRIEVSLYDIGEKFGLHEQVADHAPHLLVAYHGYPGAFRHLGDADDIYSNPGRWKIVASAQELLGQSGRYAYAVHYVVPEDLEAEDIPEH